MPAVALPGPRHMCAGAVYQHAYPFVEPVIYLGTYAVPKTVGLPVQCELTGGSPVFEFRICDSDMSLAASRRRAGYATPRNTDVATRLQSRPAIIDKRILA